MVKAVVMAKDLSYYHIGFQIHWSHFLISYRPSEISAISQVVLLSDLFRGGCVCVCAHI